MVWVWVFGVLAVGLPWLGLHPLTTYPLSLWLIRCWRYNPGTLLIFFNLRKSVCVVLLAYNEEQVVGAEVDNCLALRETRPDLQDLFYVGPDRTAEFLPHRDVKLYVAPQRAGNTHGRNRLTKLADASVLVFTDANVIAGALAGTALGIWYSITWSQFPSLDAAAICTPKSEWSVTAR